MGRYCIHIEGVGAHHNGKDYDADAMAAKVTADLKAAGHNVEFSGFFTDGGKADVFVSRDGAAPIEQPAPSTPPADAPAADTPPADAPSEPPADAPAATDSTTGEG